MKFNAEEYWATREVKVWVVTLVKYARNKIVDRHNFYVRARDRSGAISTAKNNDWMGMNGVQSCRLATPSDLGILAN